ncbi:conserved Plasmodium protein, unknown function [Plasmodium gallinaceum]|uniref:JAB1/MPN/MOV34 metalloenzyme domain-containing protein n=1 Tax=Plasmodium gallinaceum TaxID=5849 RepID=A0A1J1H1R4_PLAGA|nr:conserved Plasmodium protein, unknown function [Plasmodium gallinaceum]CRG97254.1 conserved Plasmodium protein, unknown function [Plasmodium gallinaceum]
MKNNIILICIYFIFIKNICGGLKVHKIKENYFTISKNGGNTDIYKNNSSNNNIKKLGESKKENKFFHFENKKKISINPLFQSICKDVSVSETCLHNIQNFFSNVNYNNLKSKNSKESKYFCGVLYGKYENNEFIKIENVFFSMNISEGFYDIDYLLNSEDRKKADKLAKMLNLEVVGFLYAYPDIGVDINMANKKKKRYIKLNKKIKTLNDEENEIFIPMGGKEVLLSLMLMKQILDNSKKYSEKPNELHDNSNGNDQEENENDKYKKSKNDNYNINESKKRSLKKKKKKNSNIKPFIILSVGMSKNTDSIIVEAYEINYDLLKLVKHNIIKDMKKQNSILQFEKKQNEKEMKIKKFDSEVDIMNELYLKCKNNILIKKIELKKIDILFCVNNVPIFSHKSVYNYFFPYPSNDNYYNILQKFNNMIKTIDNKNDIVNVFRDFNFLFFLTNLFSIDHDFPYFCAAVNDITNSISIPDHYIYILKNLSKNTNILD